MIIEPEEEERSTAVRARFSLGALFVFGSKIKPVNLFYYLSIGRFIYLVATVVVVVVVVGAVVLAAFLRSSSSSAAAAASDRDTSLL